jgi:hypothetical protein
MDVLKVRAHRFQSRLERIGNSCNMAAIPMATTSHWVTMSTAFDGAVWRHSVSQEHAGSAALMVRGISPKERQRHLLKWVALPKWRR